MTTEQETELAWRAADGDRAARDELILANVRFVTFLAEKFCRRFGPRLELEDAISEGTIGLIEAVDRFDPAGGYKLITYARHFILPRLRALAWKRSPVRISKHVVRLMRQPEDSMTRRQLRLVGLARNALATRLEIDLSSRRYPGNFLDRMVAAPYVSPAEALAAAEQKEFLCDFLLRRRRKLEMPARKLNRR